MNFAIVLAIQVKIAMSLTKILFVALFMTLSFNVAAKQNEPEMNENNVVIRYDYSSEECLKASTPDLHRISRSILYLAGDANLKLLGEKNDIFIPGIKECDVLFREDTYYSGEFFLFPSNKWDSLNLIIENIPKARMLLASIKDLIIKEKSFDIQDLSEEYFDKKMGAIINYYELEHYEIYILLRKFHIPKEIIPRDENYFKLYFQIRKK